MTWWFLLACSTSPDPPPATDGADVEPVDSASPLVDSASRRDTGTAYDPTTLYTTVSTASTGDTAIDPCEQLAATPLSVTPLQGYPPSEEFAFDAFGNLVNVDDSADAMFSTPFGGPTTLVAPYSAIEVAGSRFLPDGDLALCDEWEGAVVRLAPDGSRSLLASGLISPNSLAVKSTGDVYVAGYGEVVRIHPDGQVERIFERANTDFDGLAFSPDERTLWLNHDDGGVVGQLQLDANGNLISFQSIVELSGSDLDGGSVDSCGLYYVISIGGDLWRVNDAGSTQLLADLSGAGAFYTTSVRFGSGIGGWERDHVYVMDRSGEKLYDIELDVEGTPMPHWP